MRLLAVVSCLLLIAICGPTSFVEAEKESQDQCLACHTDIGSPQAESFKRDVHYKAGLGCADCHGGDPNPKEMEQAMDPAKGYTGVPDKKNIPQLCAGCHADIVEEFEAGVHGNALKQSNGGPQCVSCHGIHNILEVKNKLSPVSPTNVPKTCATCHSNVVYMKKFNPGLPVDQYEKYLTSVHGRLNLAGDWKPATCVNCHSNHLIFAVNDPRSSVYPTNIPKTCGGCHGDPKYMTEYHIPTSQYEDYKKSVHGVALLKNSNLSAPACNSCHGNHGASPPGVSSVENVCGICHQANAELFDKSVHKTAFDKKDLPGCVVCHGNHFVEPPTDAMIGVTKDSNCGSCHSPDQPVAATIVKMRNTFDELTRGQKQATDILSEAEQLGMDVAEAKYSLKDVNQSVVEARVKIHLFSLPVLQEAVRPGLKIVAGAKKTGEEALHEYKFRRQGLVISTLIITLLVGLLYLKIRRVEKEHKQE